MNTLTNLSISTASLRSASYIHKYFNLCSLTLATTATLLLASVTSAQAAAVFTNARVNGVFLETDGVPTNPTIFSDNGQFKFEFDAYTVNAPINQSDILTGTFYQDATQTSTLPKPTDFSIAYTGNNTFQNPAVLSHTITYNTSGTFTGSLQADFANSSPDYDITPANGTPDSNGRGFAFTLATPVPFEPSPTMGLFMLGAAWGAAAHLKKQKLGISKITKN